MFYNFFLYRLLVKLYTLVCHTLPAPGVDTVERAVATFDDGGIGVLADGTVFQHQYGLPMDAVVAYGNLQRGAWTLLCATKS